MLLKIDRYKYINGSVTSILPNDDYINLVDSALLHNDNIIEMCIDWNKYRIYYIMLSSYYDSIKNSTKEMYLINNKIINMFKEIY